MNYLKQAAAFLVGLTVVVTPALAQTYKVNLRPLNQSGVTGKGSLTLSSDKSELKVVLDVSGL